MFTVQMCENEYRIVGPDGEEGDPAPYTQMATLTIGAAIYYCLVNEPDNEGEDVDVFRVDRVTKMASEPQDAVDSFGDLLECFDAAEDDGGPDGPDGEDGPVLVVDEEAAA